MDEATAAAGPVLSGSGTGPCVPVSAVFLPHHNG